MPTRNSPLLEAQSLRFSPLLKRAIVGGVLIFVLFMGTGIALVTMTTGHPTQTPPPVAAAASSTPTAAASPVLGTLPTITAEVVGYPESRQFPGSPVPLTLRVVLRNTNVQLSQVIFRYRVPGAADWRELGRAGFPYEMAIYWNRLPWQNGFTLGVDAILADRQIVPDVVAAIEFPVQQHFIQVVDPSLFPVVPSASAGGLSNAPAPATLPPLSTASPRVTPAPSVRSGTATPSPQP